MTSQKLSEDKGTAVLTVEVPSEEFKQSLQAAHRKNARHFQVPGFRRGKAPYPVVVRHYGEDILYDDALEIALPKAYGKALEEQEITPFSDPRFKVKEIGSEAGLVFEVSVALRPRVKLGKYKGVEAYRPPAEVDEAAIDKRIEEARERVSRLVPVTSRPIEMGDQVTLDYKGFLGEEVFEGGEAQGHKLEIGSGTFIPGFEEGLIGHGPGDDFDLPLTFPETYHAEDLAGREVVFKVRIREVLVKELPEIDDEFVRDVSDSCDSLEEYRAEIREELAKEMNSQADQAFEQNIIDKIVADSSIELSELIVEDEIDRAMDRQEKQFAMYGLNFSDFLKYSGQTVAQYRAGQEKKSRRLIESAWVVEAIREKEKERIELSDAEFEKAIGETAEKEGISADLFRDQYLKTDHDQEHFRHDMENRKLLKWLKEVSHVTAVAPVVPDEDEDSQDQTHEE